MLSLSILKYILRLLAMGKLTQAEIAAKARVSRWTVLQIARQRVEQQSRRRASRRRAASKSRTVRSLRDEQPSDRCPHCGYVVHPPCRICAARARRAVDEWLIVAGQSHCDPIALVGER